MWWRERAIELAPYNNALKQKKTKTKITENWTVWCLCILNLVLNKINGNGRKNRNGRNNNNQQNDTQKKNGKNSKRNRDIEAEKSTHLIWAGNHGNEAKRMKWEKESAPAWCDNTKLTRMSVQVSDTKRTLLYVRAVRKQLKFYTILFYVVCLPFVSISSSSFFFLLLLVFHSHSALVSYHSIFYSVDGFGSEIK